MPASLPRRRGAPPGNINNLKHGFYSRRLKKRDLTGVEATDGSSLLDEIALIRIFTRRLVEKLPSDADFYEHAELLRNLCFASSSITRAVRAQLLVSLSGPGLNDEIEEAIRQVHDELTAHRLSPDSPASADDPLPLA